MSWFNYWGLIAVAILLLPNILYAIFSKQNINNVPIKKSLYKAEQFGRFGCMILMVFNVPYTYYGFWFSNALLVYLIVGGSLLALYYLGWLIFIKRNNMAKAIWLSVTPSILFLFCGVMIISIPLIIYAIIFAIAHITISIKNAR